MFQKSLIYIVMCRKDELHVILNFIVLIIYLIVHLILDHVKSDSFSVTILRTPLTQ